MGNRANYVLIEGDQRTIYFSRWGAPVIPSVLLSGPEMTLAYVRGLVPDDDLLDEVWAEGGMVLNVDRREIRFFGGIHVYSKPYLRRPLLTALRVLWPNWSMHWARFGIADLALSLGWDVGRVLDTEFDNPKLLHDTGPTLREAHVRTTGRLKRAQSIVTVRWSEPDVRDCALTRRSADLLSLGPRLVEILADAPTFTLPCEDDPDLPRGGAYLDVTTQALWMSSCDELDPRLIAALARRWPGWHVDGHVGGLARQVALSGRDPTPVMISHEQATHELVEELAGSHTVDPSGLYAALTRAESSLSEKKPVTFGKGFFSADGPQLSPEERREVILRLLRDAPSDSDSTLEAE